MALALARRNPVHVVEEFNGDSLLARSDGLDARLFNQTARVKVVVASVMQLGAEYADRRRTG